MDKRKFKEVSIFFIGTIFFSWFVFWGPLAFFKVQTVNLLDSEMGPIWAIILFIAGGFLPSVLGIVLTYLYEGRKGIKEMVKKTLDIKLGIKNYACMFLVPVFYAFTLILMYYFLEGYFNLTQLWSQLPLLFPLFFLGPVSEELGWRGFAIKRMLKLTTPNKASFIIGVFWALWHLPLFHMLGTSQYEYNLSFLVFFVAVVSSSYVYTYFYIKTNGSIFSAIFIHWIYTFSLQVVFTNITRTNVLFNYLEFLPFILSALVFANLLNKKRGLYKN